MVETKRILRHLIKVGGGRPACAAGTGRVVSELNRVPPAVVARRDSPATTRLLFLPVEGLAKERLFEVTGLLLDASRFAVDLKAIDDLIAFLGFLRSLTRLE